MKHLKNFSQIFENIDGRRIFTHEEIKSLPEYKELINDFGYIDTTTPIISKSGNLRFEHPDMSNQYTIYSNGYIRQQKGDYHPVWWNPEITRRGTPSILVKPNGTSPNDIIFGQEIKNLEDYNIKFKYIKHYYIKKIGKLIGVSGKSMSGKGLNDISDVINKRVKDNPESISSNILRRMVDTGLLIPDEFTNTVITAGSFGFLD